ncbi:hypothetical protein GYMLUDRAFT_1028657 [Collybiopsis luxurians FD-317 M1]|uniref:Uncharacterized protein n=1 Tax=Collybiopsis luxurians FD-317 M1 TaxID=944289 RepID=A0A0D0CCC9_9AGAR|nr:hypothetical protein GYMLUDRAFT_1028657 [Collybiopsis luxurians FD-317 M1]
MNFLYILFLFTYTDFKTIFFPVLAVAAVLGPVKSNKSVVEAALWIWVHLLQCNVSNQRNSIDEDALNRPWRPLPSGKVSIQQAIILRYIVIWACVACSSLYGVQIVLISLFLTAITIIYDDYGGATHWILKNLCAAIGYAIFEVGATVVIGPSLSLSNTAIQGICYSAIVVLTTIHAQDFSDTAGDATQGRVTLAIYAPYKSRFALAFFLLFWSLALSLQWHLSNILTVPYVGYALFVGWRYMWYQGASADGKSYVFYNIWLGMTHLLPLWRFRT